MRAFKKGCSEIWNRSLTQIKRRIIKTSCRICEDKLAGHISAQRHRASLQNWNFDLFD